MNLRTGWLLFVALALPLAGQWLDYPTAGIPRTADGQPNLSAPAPKTRDGKIDISGLWQPPPGSVANIAKDLTYKLQMLRLKP